MRRSVHGWFLLLALAGVAGDTLRAAGPEVEQLFPAGGQVGATVALEALGKFDAWPVQSQASRRGVELVPEKDKGKFTAKIAADALPGLYWFRFHDAQGASAPAMFVVGFPPEVTEQEPNDDPAQPGKLPAGPIVVNGRLEKRGDVDHFAVQLTRGGQFVASIESHALLGSPLDATLQIVSADGFVLAHNDDSYGLDPRITFTAPSDGTYLVRVLGFPAATDQSIALAGGKTFVYRLTLTSGAFADYALPLAIPPDSSLPVTLFGPNLPSELKPLATPSVAQPDWVELSHPQLANVLRLPVAREPSVLEAEPNDRDRPQSIALPSLVSGRIETPGNDDCFRFTGVANQKLLLAVTSRVLGYPLDPVLEVFDASGKSLTKIDDAGVDRDATLEFAPPADGEYVVRVSDLHGTGSPRHVYYLRIAPAEPDYQLTLGSDRVSGKAGEKIEVPVSIARLHGFASELVIEMENLPPGATCEPVKSPTEGDAAKSVKLALQAGSEPFSGPVRVVGRIAPGDAPSRRATFSVAGKPLVLDELWLTILPESPPAK